jgi:hypothetical protein
VTPTAQPPAPVIANNEQATANPLPVPPPAPNPQPASSAADNRPAAGEKVVSAAPPPGKQEPATPAKAEPKPVGSYISPEKGPPSILLQRRHDGDAWGRLRPAERVYTEHYLVSLPGYRSKIYIDDPHAPPKNGVPQSGVHMTLWGNVPEFSPYPPVYESMVVLHEPGPGIDLDFTLERGRVEVANFKPKGEARARVRFGNQDWEITIPDNQSEVVIQLWGYYPPDTPFSPTPGKGPVETVTLYVQGKAQLKVGQQVHQLGDKSVFAWGNRSTLPMGAQTLTKLPDWWTDRPPQTDQAKEMLYALLDMRDALDKNPSVVDAILTVTRESKDKDIANRQLGVWILAAIDAIPQLIDALEDRQHYEIRQAATGALINWISHAADDEIELYRMLQEKKGFSKEKAQIIMSLLHVFSPEDRANPKTYETLISYLDHDNLAIRELALWHLIQLTPPNLLKNIRYDPAEDGDKRKAGVEQWKKLLADRQLPPPQGR